MTGLADADAFDAALITGGLPVICARWHAGEDMWSFLTRELADPFSPLTASAQLSLAAEFPDQAQARAVLAAIGSGERTFTNIARTAGGIAHSTLPAAGLPAAPVVGGYWTRSDDVEIDIVGADRGPVARRLLFLGSIKWLDHTPFDAHDLVALQRHRDRVTSDPVPLLAASRTGATAKGLDAVFGPGDLLPPWQG